jgi:hypothetical protein
MYEKNQSQLNADEKYRHWMHSRYNDYKKMLLDSLAEGNNASKVNKFPSEFYINIYNK